MIFLIITELGVAGQVPDEADSRLGHFPLQVPALKCPHRYPKRSHPGISSAQRAAGPPGQSLQPLVSRGAELLLEMPEEPLGLLSVYFFRIVKTSFRDKGLEPADPEGPFYVIETTILKKIKMTLKVLSNSQLVFDDIRTVNNQAGPKPGWATQLPS